MSTMLPFRSLSPANLEHPTQVYLMPHELIWLERNVEALLGSQQGLGDGLGGAMQAGHETDHDNAPADAIVSDSRALVDGAGNMSLYRTYNLGRYSLLEYPNNHEPDVLPGSIAEVWFDDLGEDAERFQIGGGMTLGEDGLGRYDTERLTPGDVTQITYRSPFAQALIGNQAGDEFTYSTPIGTTIKAKIGRVEQRGMATYQTILEPIVANDRPSNRHHGILRAAILTKSLISLSQGANSATPPSSSDKASAMAGQQGK